MTFNAAEEEHVNVVFLSGPLEKHSKPTWACMFTLDFRNSGLKFSCSLFVHFEMCAHVSRCSFIPPQFLSTLFAPLNFIMEKVESLLPSSLWHQLTRIWSHLMSWTWMDILTEVPSSSEVPIASKPDKHNENAKERNPSPHLMYNVFVSRF